MNHPRGMPKLIRNNGHLILKILDKIVKIISDSVYNLIMTNVSEFTTKICDFLSLVYPLNLFIQ